MTTNTNAAPTLHDRVMEVITDVWDRQLQIDEATATVIDLCEASTAAQPPAGWPRASISDSRNGWTLDCKFLDKVEQIARNRTEYGTSMETTEQVLIAALEVLAVAPKAEPVQRSDRAPLTETQLRKLHHIEEFGLFCDYDEFEQIARAIETAHDIKPAKEQA